MVVAGSSVRFARARVTPWRNALLLTGVAAPAALLGGLTPIDEATFLTILGASLVLTALTLLLRPRDTATGAPPRFARLMPQLLTQETLPMRRVDLRYTNGFAVAWAESPGPEPRVAMTANPQSPIPNSGSQS